MEDNSRQKMEDNSRQKMEDKQSIDDKQKIKQVKNNQKHENKFQIDLNERIRENQSPSIQNMKYQYLVKLQKEQEMKEMQEKKNRKNEIKVISQECKNEVVSVSKKYYKGNNEQQNGDQRCKILSNSQEMDEKQMGKKEQKGGIEYLSQTNQSDKNFDDFIEVTVKQKKNGYRKKQKKEDEKQVGLDQKCKQSEQKMNHNREKQINEQNRIVNDKIKVNRVNRQEKENKEQKIQSRLWEDVDKKWESEQSVLTQDSDTKRIKNKENQWCQEDQEQCNNEQIGFNNEQIGFNNEQVGCNSEQIGNIEQKIFDQQFEEGLGELIRQNNVMHNLRIVIYNRIQCIVQKLLDDIDVRLFGSCYTGLQLPESDIDITMVSIKNTVVDREKLVDLDRYLEHFEFVESRHLIMNTTVPVLKLNVKPFVSFDECDATFKEVLDQNNRYINSYNVDRQLYNLNDEFIIKVDITIQDHQKHLGIFSSNLVSYWLNLYPQLEKIVLFVKYFLNSRDLNNAFTGGLSSYQITILCLAIVKDMDKQNSYYQLLSRFFSFYGKQFNYQKTIVSIFNQKSSFVECEQEQQSCCLKVADPLKFGGDIHSFSNLTQNVSLVEQILQNFSLVDDKIQQFNKDAGNLVQQVSKGHLFDSICKQLDYSIFTKIMQINK